MVPRSSSRPLGSVALVAALGMLAFIAAYGLETSGRDLLVIAVARLGFLAGALGVVAAHPVVRAGGLGRVGVGLATAGAVLFALGATAHVVQDGWSYNPFELEGATPPWYSFVIGAGGFLFALGAALAGAGALRRDVPRPLAVALLLGGALYLLAIPLAGAGHALWALPWLAVGGLLLARGHDVVTARAAAQPGAVQ